MRIYICKKSTIRNIFLFIIIIIITGISILTIFSHNMTAQVTSENVEEEIHIEEEKNYIKWVNCNVTVQVLEKTAKVDIDSHVNNEEIKFNWIELIAYLACKYGNDFKRFKQKDLDALVEKIKKGQTIEELTQNQKYYSYYFESYDAILNQFIGEFEIEVMNEEGEKTFEKRYGIKAFLPIAKKYGFSHYDDFGSSRSYGFKRTHLGNDLMGAIGTPIIAVESGIVEALRMEPIWRMENWNKKL